MLPKNHSREKEKSSAREYFIAEQAAPASHLTYLEGCSALRLVLITVPRVCHSYEHFPDGFDLHLLQVAAKNTELGALELTRNILAIIECGRIQQERGSACPSRSPRRCAPLGG